MKPPLIIDVKTTRRVFDLGFCCLVYVKTNLRFPSNRYFGIWVSGDKALCGFWL
jgi:hypothetical protein